MTFDDFVQFLVAESEADGHTTWVEGLLDEAKSKMTGAKGEFSTLTNASLNGKTFQRFFQFTALDTVRACRRALNIFNNEDDTVSSTNAGFARISR